MPTGQPVPRSHGTCVWAQGQNPCLQPSGSRRSWPRAGEPGKGPLEEGASPASRPSAPILWFPVCRWWCHAQVTASSGNRTRDVGMRSPHPSLLPETPTPPPGNQAEGLHLHKAEWPWPEPEGPRPWTPSWSALVQRMSRGAAGSLSAPARCPPGRTTSDQGSQGRPASSPAVRLYAEDRQ